MKSTKDHEMNLVKQRNNRLRIIQNELNFLEKLKDSKIIHSEIIQDPEYLFDEQPEKIIQVFINIYNFYITHITHTHTSYIFCIY